MPENPDKILRDKVAAGEPYAAGGNAIDADTIWRLVRSLPFEGEDEPSPTTSAGIVIHDAIIVGRINLDCAVGGDCCPTNLSFHDCDLIGGFSGANGQFRSLCFEGCRFADISEALAEPAIDLRDARIDSGLLLRAIRPGERGKPLWIDAANVRIAGPLDLSEARLRWGRAAPNPKWAAKAIDLMGAEICGDLTLKNADCQGQIYARAVHVHGDLRMSGMSVAVNRGIALFLQSAVIEGMALLCDDRDPGDQRGFVCEGDLSLRAANIGDDLHIEGATINGYANCLDLAVGNDLLFYAEVGEGVDLTGCRLGGTLDLSELCIPKKDAKLLLVDGTIGRVLRLAIRKERRKAEDCVPQPGQRLDSDFRVGGEIDLRGLSCDMLDDDDGRLWPRGSRIQMNHFVYRRMGWRGTESGHKRSHEHVLNWLRGKRAEGGRPFRWISKILVPEQEGFWAPWQIRRNWLYQQFEVAGGAPDLIARHVIAEHEYHPQPFEQVIRAARAEGDEEFVVHFEMLKQRIEWRFFNRQVRWWLAFAAIGLASLWLLVDHGPGPGFWVDGWTFGWTVAALLATVLFMFFASGIRDLICRMLGREPSKAGHLPRRLTWLVYWFPALLLLVLLWRDRPFHFIVAFFIFVAIRLLGVMAHFVMRWGFGYLRRPVRAVITLILAFLVGWWGVHIANHRNMLVVAAAPVAPVVGPDRDAHYPGGYDARGTPALFGSRSGPPGLAREISCAATVSEPLYALDLLIPIVDLGEESRCEVRRIADHHGQRSIVHPKSFGFPEMFWSIPDLPLNDHRFWWWMKALYAVAGWFIVSLSILTFAQVNRAHAEPPTEHK